MGEHKVGVLWSSELQRYQILVDGQSDRLLVDGLRRQAISDDPDTSLVLGIAVGHRVNGGVSNGDMAKRMLGTIREVRYNGQPVRIAIFSELGEDIARIDLGSDRGEDFRLMACIETLASSATIVAKA